MRKSLKIFVEIASSLLLSAIGVMMAGLILGSMSSYIESLPGFIVLVPALLNMRGCIASSLAARLGTAIHLGVIDWRLNAGSRNELKQNIYASFIITAATSVLIGVLAFITCILLNLPNIGLVGLTSISLFSGLLAAGVMIFLTIGIATYSTKKGLDPDDVTIPTLTTLGDIITISAIFLTVILFGGMR